MTGQAGKTNTIDGKYEVLRELLRQNNVTLSEVRDAEGVPRKVAWFDINASADRQAFHQHRTALRALNPAGLVDVVARPGAYYTVWQEVTGTPLSEYLGQKVKSEESVEAIKSLAANLATLGYAIADADIKVENNDPKVAYLNALPIPHTADEITTMNNLSLASLNGGKIKRKKEAGAWLTFVPGLVFLAGAAFYGAQATKVFLNPPVTEVLSVAGQEAKSAAKKLSDAGFRVEYTEGQAANIPIGSIIRQDPAAGTTLPLGRLVTITVNNPPSIEVPRLEEMGVNQASDILKDRTMTLGKILKVDGTLSQTPEGRIISQVPEAMASAQRGQAVQVLVSTGVKGKMTWLPNLTGLTYEQARDYAQTADLVITKVDKKGSEQPENTVISQTPAPFVRVDVKSPVTLVVAIARYTPPSKPVTNLPLPPAPVPEVPVPETPAGQPDPIIPPAVQPIPDQPQTNPDPIAPNTVIPTPNSATPDPVPTSDPVPTLDPAVDTGRSVAFSYTFLANLPSGTYSVTVRDAKGEREILSATDAATLAGQVANATVNVYGTATFVIKRDGNVYDTLKP